MKNKAVHILLLAFACVWVGHSPVLADDLALYIESQAKTIFKAFTRNHTVETELNIESDKALDIQNYYIALLRPTWGMDVGYASLAMNADVDLKVPPTGILLENMFTGTRAVITRSFGVDMHAAAEILFRVKSEEINTAATREDALKSLYSVIPGVRLSDKLLQAADNNAAESQNLAMNLEVRFCVLGTEIPLLSGQNWNEKLEQFSLSVYDQSKTEIAVQDESAKVHPLDAVMATRDALHQRGIHLLPQDILAIGPLTEQFEVEQLSRLRVVYHGLSEEPTSVYMGFQ